MAAFSSAGQLRRRPAPVNTSMRRAHSGIGVSSDIDMCRSSKPAPNVTPHAWLRKALPRRRLLKAGVPASFTAYAQGETPIELYLVKDGQVVAQHAQGRWF